MFHPPQSEPVRTIEVSSADIQAAARLLRLINGDPFPHSKELGTVDISKHRLLQQNLGAGRPELTARARQIYAERRRRSKIFSPAMFGEPAWDMLLGLYITAAARRSTVGRVIQLADTPPTTALRWVDYLEKQKLVVREPHPTDRRSAFISLSERGHLLLETYLSDANAP